MPTGEERYFLMRTIKKINIMTLLLDREVMGKKITLFFSIEFKINANTSILPFPYFTVNGK